MTPDEVPADLVEKAARAIWEYDTPAPELGWPHWDVVVIRSDADVLFAQLVADTRTMARHALAAVLPEIQAQALMDFADGLPSDWKRPNGPADAARAHAEHLLECTCAEAARRTTTEGSDV